MNKEKLLKLINEDTDVRDAIINILNKDEPTITINKDNEEIEMLKNLVEKWKKCFKDEEIKQEGLHQDISKLQRVKDELATLNEELQSKKDTLTSLNNNLENDVQNLHSDNKNIQNSNTKLSKTIEFYRASRHIIWQRQTPSPVKACHLVFFALDIFGPEDLRIV